jgi:hypothetical protein
VKLDQPAKEVFVRYLGDPGVNAVRVYAHCLRERPCAASPVVIRHAFRERGVLEERTFRLEGPGAYDIDAEEPEDEWIEISVPSVKR